MKTSDHTTGATHATHATDATDANEGQPNNLRRRLLQGAGSAALLIPTVALLGCSGDDKPAASASAAMDAAKKEAADAVASVEAAAADTAASASEAADSAMNAMGDAAGNAADTVKDAADSAMDAAGDVVDSATSAASNAGGLVKLEESDGTAQALSYVHDASDVDTAKQTRFVAGQACSNCAQYKGVEDGWGSCAIFPGKLVAEAGWCAGYIAAS